MYVFLDYFFVVFHSFIIVFNLFGWIWKKTRLANLITLVLTGASWFILGIFYGIGYCPLTDWHWQVLRKLGRSNIPNSYIEYLAERISGFDFDPDFVDTVTLTGFIVALIISIIVNVRSRRKR